MYHLAQLNVGRLVGPLDSDVVKEFVDALDAMNLLAEASVGFVWRLIDEGGRSSSFVSTSSDPQEVINLSVWESIEALKHYTYKSGHSAYLRRRREWFEAPKGPHLVCWWIPEGDVPTPDEALARLERLANEGPSSEAFTLVKPFDSPSQ